MVLFDRSWYNRAGVEHVMGFCTEAQYQEFFQSCPEFERILQRSGIRLIKYWFSVSDEEQERRFQDRMKNPTKRWKLSPKMCIRDRWWAVSHGADKTGPLAGVPYDGADPQYADLYHDADCARFADRLDWNDDGIPNSWKLHYLDRMTDLIDKYQPDFLYTDGHLPFEDVGLKMVAHLYNCLLYTSRCV